MTAFVTVCLRDYVHLGEMRRFSSLSGDMRHDDFLPFALLLLLVYRSWRTEDIKIRILMYKLCSGSEHVPPESSRNIALAEGLYSGYGIH